MVSRGLLETDHLPAVLAHELGHLASPDARLTTAINRLIVFSTPIPRRCGSRPSTAADGLVLACNTRRVRRRTRSTSNPTSRRRCSGSCGSCSSSRCSRKAASDYGSPAPSGAGIGASASTTPTSTPPSLGQADELADFLEIHALIHDNPIPFLWLTEHTHPPTELRIDRLRPQPDEISADTEPKAASEVAPDAESEAAA